MRRAGPYRGQNSGPGEDDPGELDTETRKLENKIGTKRTVSVFAPLVGAKGTSISVVDL
jgi:hypothetical protein